MEKETIYNLFSIVENERIEKVGIATHNVSIPDDEKDAFLAKHAENDLKRMQIFPVYEKIRSYDIDTDEDLPGIHYSGYNMFKKSEMLISLFEGALNALEAPNTPYVYYSVVESGSIVRQNE
jgi:hypothetical protein